MPADVIEKIGNSLIQHGPLNDRVYLMSMAKEDKPHIAETLERISREKGYSKIFAKIPAGSLDCFVDHGYRIEARVPGLYLGREEGLFLGRFLTPARAEEKNGDLKREVLELALAAPQSEPGELTAEIQIKLLGKDDLEGLAALYTEVFASYPFPVYDPGFLSSALSQGVVYLGAFKDGELLGAAACEVDKKSMSAEMTDFAVHPLARGLGLSRHLLKAMEKEMKRAGVLTLFTIARTLSHGMNLTFARAGYEFSGSLVNNTNISGAIESMNVWFKKTTA